MLNKIRKIVPLVMWLAVIGCANFGNGYSGSSSANLSALESANVLIKAQPNNYLGYYLAAQAYQQLNESSAINLNYRKALQLNGEDINVNLSYARYLCQQSDYSGAQTYYSKLQHRTSLPIKFYLEYADCLTSQNQLEPAVVNYQQTLKLDKNNASAYLGLIYVYNLLAKYNDAYHLINKYPGIPNKNFLELKVFTLQELLLANSTLYDKEELDQQLIETNAQLKLINSESSVVVLSKSNNITTPSTLNQTESIHVLIVPDNNNQSATTKPQSIINSSNLEVDKSVFSSRIKELNGQRFIIVEKGDTLYNLSHNSNIPIAKLIQLNKVKDNRLVLNTKFYLN